MKEADFSLEIKHSLESQFKDVHYKKIPDQPFNPSSFVRFNPDKSYDSYVVIGGCFSALEYKLHKSKNAFPLKDVSLIQRASLMDVVDAGGNAYVVIGVRYESVRKAFFISITDFLTYCRSCGRQSMPLEIMDTYPQVPWAGKGMWKLDENLFKYKV